MISVALFTALSLAWSTYGSSPELTAILDYGSFQGAYSTTYNISYWQKIPFAAPPLGQTRFRAPQPPIPITNGTYDSSQPFDMCPQRTVNGSEDCLYLGLYGRFWSQGEPLRPVVVNFYGGAYIEGDAYFTLPPSGYPVLNVSQANDFIFVEPNYRVNAFGFLPGKEVEEDPQSDLNPGLLDQQAALQWTHQYISAFGGDPSNVTIWGQSAGAGSVVAQVIANGGATHPKLFTKALASSPFWVKTYKYNAPEAQAIYDNFVNMTGCSVPGSLQCLKRANLQDLRTAALAISASHTYNTSSYTWAPVIDGTFLSQPLSSAVANRQVNADFGWGMYNLFEGQNFVPPGFQNASGTGLPYFNDSEASFNAWVNGYLPELSTTNVQRLLQLYPVTGSADALPSYNTTYARAGLIFRDSTLACPAYWMANTSHSQGYLGEYTIFPATHGSDTEWVYSPPTCEAPLRLWLTRVSQWNRVNHIQQTYPLTYDGFAGAFASFFETGDPNANKVTSENIPGVPLLSSSAEFVIENSTFANIGIPQLRERCAFWQSVADEVPI